MTGDSPLRSAVGESGVGFPKPLSGPQSLSSLPQALLLTETMCNCHNVQKKHLSKALVSSVLAMFLLLLFCFSYPPRFPGVLGIPLYFRQRCNPHLAYFSGPMPLICSLCGRCKTQSSKETGASFLSSNRLGMSSVDAVWIKPENAAASISVKGRQYRWAAQTSSRNRPFI